MKEQTRFSNRTPDYSHIKEVKLVENSSIPSTTDDKLREFLAVEIGLGSDQSDLFTFLCFVLKDLNLRAPRSLPNIAKYLLTGTFVENFEKNDVGIELYKGFCFLELSTVSNIDYSIPRKTGKSRTRVFMMSRATGDYVISEKIRRTKDGKLANELKHRRRCFGYVEDMEDAFISGGGNGLAKYFATINPGRHIALPPIDSETLYLKFDCYRPNELYRPGILRRVMRKGRPLKTSVCGTLEEKEATTTACVERVSRVDAETGGWVVSW